MTVSGCGDEYAFFNFGGQSVQIDQEIRCSGIEANSTAGAVGLVIEQKPGIVGYSITRIECEASEVNIIGDGASAQVEANFSRSGERCVGTLDQFFHVGTRKIVSCDQGLYAYNGWERLS